MSPKGKTSQCLFSLIFRYFATKQMLKNLKRVPLLGFFCTRRLFKILIFCLILCVFNICPQNIFFQYCLNFRGGGSRILRYIRIFNVISELYCVSLRRRRRFKNKRFLLPSTLYPNFGSSIRIYVLQRRSRRMKKALVNCNQKFQIQKIMV